MRTFDTHAVRVALDFNRLIPALAQMFARGCEVPPRQVLNLQPGLTVSLIMPAWEKQLDASRASRRRYYGVKVINVAPDNQERGLPGLFATYTLFDADTGEPLANIEANELTARRTVAASALAASQIFAAMRHRDSNHLTPKKMLILGSGRVATLLAKAYAAVLPVEEVAFWSRNPENARNLVHRLQTERSARTPTPGAFDSLKFNVVSDLKASAGQADIVSCATLASTPIIHGAWLKPGGHLDLIGSFTPAMREADDECFKDRFLFVDTQEAFAKSGDLIAPMERGVIEQAQLSGTLADLCQAKGVVLNLAKTASNQDPKPDQVQAQETHPAKIGSVFKSVGTALEDLAAAILVYESNLNERS